MLQTALVAGADVKTADAQPLGTVATIDGDNVVVEREGGALTLPREVFAVEGGGDLTVRATMAQIEEALAGCQG